MYYFCRQKNLRTHAHTQTCTHMFRVALSAVAKKWNQPKCPSPDD